jgi:hypothetical protein
MILIYICLSPLGIITSAMMFAIVPPPLRRGSQQLGIKYVATLKCIAAPVDHVIGRARNIKQTHLPSRMIHNIHNDLLIRNIIEQKKAALFN